ncbi:uncharacterized protein [Littorina saxatilis]|uniref:GH10 domain-containing protein n=1 Tax=Littorina saxatilis TaxID=31220 RepID=A0AAN9BCB2_9CAEN
MATAVHRLFWLVSVLVNVCSGGELLHNGDLESLDSWVCYKVHCEITTDHHCGHHSLKASQRSSDGSGPGQSFNATQGWLYMVTAWVKLLNDVPGKLGQPLSLMADYTFTDGHRHYDGVVDYPLAQKADGWIQLQAAFKAPNRAIKAAHMTIRGPDAAVDFLLDCASITNIWHGSGWRASADKVIHDVRQSDVNIHVTTQGKLDKSNVQIQVLQKKKSFPIGTVVNAWHYDDQKQSRYRSFIHDHFNWAVHESTMKWKHIEPFEGRYHFELPLRVLGALKKNGLKVRGHNLIWSTNVAVQDWVKHLSGDHLRNAVEHHITQTMNQTRGKLEHWDVNNENLQGQWYQERLNDFNFELTPFRIAHHNDPHVKLFLNDYNIVAHGKMTGAYVAQAERLKKANVGLYGLGVQCHFYNEEAPDPDLIKIRLDMLAKTGLPVWVTEFNIVAADENKRAEFVETAMRAFYGHPVVEGILLWGFWDQSHSRGPHAALVKGDNLEMTAAGHRFLDLWENQWMTDETRVLSKSGSQFTVRGFHGDYEVHVRYQGKDLGNLKQTFTLGETSHTVNINVHV